MAKVNNLRVAMMIPHRVLVAAGVTNGAGLYCGHKVGSDLDMDEEIELKPLTETNESNVAMAAVQICQTGFLLREKATPHEKEWALTARAEAAELGWCSPK